MNRHVENSFNSLTKLKSLVFTPMNGYTEIILSKGIVILDRAKVSNCEINDLKLNMTYTEEGQVVTKKRLFHQFFHKKQLNTYSVDFMKQLTNTCWVNIKEPTRFRFDVKGMGIGKVELKYFVIRI